MARSCTYCGAQEYTQFHCRLKPRKQLRAKQGFKKLGKQAIRWMETRNEWLKRNPGRSWNCYLCGRPLTIETLTLDHVKSRGRHPELRYELSNLRPCCEVCNTAKGSRDATELGSGHTPPASAA
jgi:5-methylcytosine-specific restriction endonuclease McrA